MPGQSIWKRCTKKCAISVLLTFITTKVGSTHMNKATMAKYSEEGVDVRLRGEVEPGPHVPARRGDPCSISAV